MMAQKPNVDHMAETQDASDKPDAKPKTPDATQVASGNSTTDGSSSSKAGKSKKGATQLGDFKLVRKLGQGGMGEVFLAKQRGLDREVAVKTLSKELAKRPNFVERFLREARSMARLQHPNVVQVYAADSDKGYHFLAIEFIDGQSMQDWMDQLGKLSISDALHVIIVCCEALKHAHDQGMVHRDIKPDNILVTKKGVVKVADFGLAKAVDEDVSVTQSGTGLGTPLYMAPEQARNAKHVDHRSDIYAIGSTLYYFVTGELPFRGDNTLALIVTKEKGTFTSARKKNSEVPERLDLMIDKMLSKDPDHRYSDYTSLLKDLGSIGMASPSLTFIDSEDKAFLSSSASPTSIGMMPSGSGMAATRIAATKVGTPTADAAPVPPKDRAPRAKTEIDTKKVWFVEYLNRQGKKHVAKMSTGKIQQGIAAGAIGPDARAKSSTKGEFKSLMKLPEFAGMMRSRKVAATEDSKKKKMQDVIQAADRAVQQGKRWRWLRRLKESTLGYFGLLIYLAILCGIGYGIYWVFPYVWDWAGTMMGVK